MTSGAALQFACEYEAASDSALDFSFEASNSSDPILTFLNRWEREKSPPLGLYYYYLGAMMHAEGSRKDAVAYYQMAIDNGFENDELRANLGLALYELGNFSEAMDILEKALRLEAGSTHALTNIAVVLYGTGRIDEAEDCYKRILRIDPNNAKAHNNLGVIMQSRGRLGEAEDSYRRAIAFKPDFTKAHLHYVSAKKITRRDDDEMLIADLEELAARAVSGSDQESDAHFALGKCYDDLGDYEKAFWHYTKGHDMACDKDSFDPVQHRDEVSGLMATFDREFFSQRATFGSSSKLPIFIVGMPRSGTTLVEQIVSSHPEVWGAGELSFWSELRQGMPVNSVMQIEQQEASSMADAYVAHLRSVAPTVRHVTDKMPNNFFHLGLIRLCFPNARIIHCKRNPLDTCLSIYTQKFVTPHSYAHKLENLALYYEQYERLMQHWEKALPGQMFEVQYEDMVANQDAISRKLLEFCDVEWDDKCLAFERNERIVQTASNWQVRQPMYATSIARWKNYQAFLEPLMHLQK